MISRWKQLYRRTLVHVKSPISFNNSRAVGTLSSLDPSPDPTTYCSDFLRKHDYESFLISQFYPKEMQGGYLALKAFSVRIYNIVMRLY